MDIGAYIESSPLFAGLEPALIDAISEKFEPVLLKAGDIVFREGDREKSFYLIASGEVVILKGSGISQRELKRLRAGQGFGEMALVATDGHRCPPVPRARLLYAAGKSHGSRPTIQGPHHSRFHRSDLSC